ncbi:MAG TPA: metallophosphoesterase [Thermoanaerobaculia bacterium]|jgi:predicted MPP superfamily phosphohydrolase|nr:metallophosphoesterase [Thermoanaerobaculia bacterium]
MLRVLFFVLLVLALVGDARVFFFVANRIVFGSHRKEKSPFEWLLKAVPLLLVGLTLLFWPLHRWIQALASNELVDRFTPERLEQMVFSLALAKIGASWLFIAAGIGAYWLVDRTRVLLQGERRVPGTRTHASEVSRLRKAHIPWALLRRLGAHNDLYDLEMTKHEVFIERLPQSFDGYRIAFLTDTHVASFVRRDFYDEIVKQTMRFDPDLILFGGDFVHWQKDIPLMAEVLMSGLRARDGVYAVLGNHDYWANPDAVIATLTARGVHFIHNLSVPLRRGRDRIMLLGIDELYRGKPDLDAAFAAVEPGVVRIGLSHHPDVVDLLEGRQIDLLVCGHTHGGQIRFPFFGSVVVPSKHEGRYASGFHRVDDVLLYVSRGIGAIPPVRILCKPEVATFTLRPATHAPFTV